MNRLQEKYLNEVKGQLMEEFKYSSVMECPKLVKIVINFGVGEARLQSYFARRKDV